MNKNHRFIFALAGVLLSGSVLASETQGTWLPVADLVSSAADRSSVPLVDSRALMAGLGAIGGVILVNYMAGGTRAVTGVMRTGMFTGAGSRFYAVTGAIAGALVADYFYRKNASNP